MMWSFLPYYCFDDNFNKVVAVNNFLVFILLFSMFFLLQNFDRKRIRKHLLVFSLAAPVLALVTFYGLSKVALNCSQFFWIII